ncbi:MAG: hypothetical protein IPK19_25020 [Chloroflexi bacterium]|nr:hypothetical protein [Chloroflexota bacterium]
MWLEKDVPLKAGLDSANAVTSAGFSSTAVQKIVSGILDRAPRIQRHIVTELDTRLPMHAQNYPDVRREVIGGNEYVVAPLVRSAYSDVKLIAPAATTVGSLRRIQLMVQSTGTVDWTMPRDVFATILTENREFPEEAESVAGLYVTGSTNPLKQSEFWLDNTNVAHYSDIIDSTRRAISHLNGQAEAQQIFQLFQKTLVDIAFLLGVQSDRWVPFQVYKWIGQCYVPIINIPPRSPN